MKSANGTPQNKISLARRNYKSRKTKTEQRTEQPLHLMPIKQTSNANERSQALFVALKNISDKGAMRPYTLNLSIPVILNHSNKLKMQSYQIRNIKQKDCFVSKLRRRQQARSKILLERLENESKNMSLLQLSEKWKESAIMPENVRSRAHTIKQMKNKIRQRNQFSSSQNRARTQQSVFHSRLNNFKNFL